jgi:hypothetical protein
MSEAEEIGKVVRALQKVPEKKLLLIELANSIPKKGGDLDPAVLMDMIPEINTATAEAVAYGTQTLNAINVLVGVRGRTDAPELRPMTEEDLVAMTQF